MRENVDQIRFFGLDPKQMNNFDEKKKKNLEKSCKMVKQNKFIKHQLLADWKYIQHSLYYIVEQVLSREKSPVLA